MYTALFCSSIALLSHTVWITPDIPRVILEPPSSFRQKEFEKQPHQQRQQQRRGRGEAPPPAKRLKEEEAAAAAVAVTKEKSEEAKGIDIKNPAVATSDAASTSGATAAATAAANAASAVAAVAIPAPIVKRTPKLPDAQLVFAFTYFDVNRCGYLEQRDVEDLFSILGLHLSRRSVEQKSV